MLFQECGSKNAGVAGYAEAFGIRAIGKAGKYLGQLFKKRCTSIKWWEWGMLMSDGDHKAPSGMLQSNFVHEEIALADSESPLYNTERIAIGWC